MKQRYTLTEGATGAKNHAIADGARIIAQVSPSGYPIGKGWSPDSEAIAATICNLLNRDDQKIG